MVFIQYPSHSIPMLWQLPSADTCTKSKIEYWRPLGWRPTCWKCFEQYEKYSIMSKLHIQSTDHVFDVYVLKIQFKNIQCCAKSNLCWEEHHREGLPCLPPCNSLFPSLYSATNLTILHHALATLNFLPSQSLPSSLFLLFSSWLASSSCLLLDDHIYTDSLVSVGEL